MHPAARRRAWPLALPMIPYMRANLARKRHGPRGSRRDRRRQLDDRRRSRARVRRSSRDARIEIIPNPVDIAACVRAPPRPRRRLPGPYALYVGKLAPNKGTEHLVDVVEQRRTSTGRSSSSATGPVARASRPRRVQSSQDVRFTGWIDQAGDRGVAGARLAAGLPVARTGVAEPRALEASALGVPIAAMNTGGTRRHRRPRRDRAAVGHAGGARATTSRRLARTTSCGSASVRRRGATPKQHFDAAAVVARVEALYARCCSAGRGDRTS